MIALLSPAKSLDYDSDLPPHDSTAPRFEERTRTLVSAASNLTKQRLSSIMSISDKLTDLNYARYRDFWDQPERAAIWSGSSIGWSAK